MNAKWKPRLLSRLFFWWEIPIILKGWRHGIVTADVYPVLQEYDSQDLGDKLEKVWLEESRKGNRSSLIKAFITMFGYKCLIFGVVLFPIDLCLALTQPFLLKKLLDYHTPNQTEVSKEQAYIYASSIVGLSLIYILIFHNTIFELYNLGMKLRIACTSLMFRKCLNMKKQTLQQFTTGKIINLLSNDVFRFDLAFSHFHYMWMSPVKILASIYYMGANFGSTSTVGIIALVVALIVQILLSKKTAASRGKIAFETDYRIRLMNDISTGIQLIKMYTWEKPFSELIQKVRKSELKEITAANHYRISSSIIKIYLPKISIFFCILAAYFSNIPLTAQYVFALTNIYENLKFTTIIRMPLAFFRFAEAKISIQRIQEFLLLSSSSKRDSFISAEKNIGIFIENLTVKWGNNLDSTALQEITISAKMNQLVCIVGHVGSGKSTLLQVILNEIDVTEGTVHVNGNVAYASQEPWIFPGTIKENLLFGADLDVKKYKEIVKITALEHDLNQFCSGDETLIGERGVTLSGGQKARINLARALYRNADIYLLDDPLSAADANVANQIFNECILTYLKEKCVVLVTHQTHLLRNFEKVYLLESGKISKILTSTQSDQIEVSKKYECTSIDTKKLKTTDLIEQKESRGAASDYLDYYLGGNNKLLALTILLLLSFNQALGYLIDYFVTFCINMPEMQSTGFLQFYGSLILFLIASTHIGSWLFVNYSFNISKNFHNRLFSRVINAPIKFFHDHSIGKIMNRFSTDLSHVDEYIPSILNEVITQVLMVFGLTTVICLINYRMIIPSILLYVVFYYCAIIFQPSNISIRGIEASARSPIFAHVSTSLQGLTTIKAMKAKNLQLRLFNKHQNFHSATFYLFRSIFFSFGFWTDIMLLFYTGAVAFSFFYLQAPPGDVGLAITLSTILGGMIQLGMKSWGELDSYIASVGRIKAYTKLPQELYTLSHTLPKSWPQKGNLIFQNVSMRYFLDAALVLKQVCFEVAAREKVGIIGRTGAGKTSLISALFRLFEFDGSIIIDGVNTKFIPLDILRSKISVIPQEPVLFLGSLRRNLDPFNEFTDFQLWSSLEEVQLKEIVGNLHSGLDAEILEGGSNFSVGQRQLLCLVRAMLRDCRILVLDEATANIDLNTDEIIQKIIRKRFKYCTVLTIAHRLNTVLESEKILVIENGRVVEFGPTKELLRNPNGFLSNYVKHSFENYVK